MSDNLDPSGPSQPRLNDAYTTAGNPAETSSAEKNAAARNRAHNTDAAPVDERVPTKQTSSISEATPSSLGYGIHGAPPGEEARGFTAEDVGRNKELDGEQMRAPGEGDVARAVEGKAGASGAQEDLASGLDAKKAEQAPAREQMKEQRAREVDVGGVLGQRGGPANPVDKKGYPNSGD